MWLELLMTLLSVLGTLVFVTLNALIFALVYVKILGSGFGKANYKPSKATNDNVRFCDVLGVDEAKLEAQEIVEFLKRSEAFQAIGAKVPKGLLMVGPPGTGKTLLAKAIANEAGVPFFSLSGSDFVEVFVGVGASRIRKLYAEARKHKAAIVFIDEIDALGRARSSNMFGGQESNNTLNAFLVELDGFGRGGNVLTIGATNMEESLDAALLRPGRFDRKLYVGLPSLRGRREILAHYMAKVQVDASVELDSLAGATAMMSGADLAAIVNEASILAVRNQREAINAKDFSKAIERLGIGQEQGKTLSPKERRIVAVHEAGHALVSYYSACPQRLHKVSIIPTGRSALGYTWSVETEDRHLTSREESLAEIAVLFGGRLAEEAAFGSGCVTGGAASDLARAAQIAETMVWDLGFAPGFPGSYRAMNLSEVTKRQLNEAVAQLLDEGQAIARGLLASHEEALQRLSAALLEREVLYRAEIEALFQPPRPSEVEIRWRE